MYLDYFGLDELPFAIAPDPRYLFMSMRHREALAHLLYGVEGQGGFVVLTGEVGTGKTTICRCFLNQVPDHTDVALIVNPKLSARELLASVCDEYGIPYQPAASIKALNDALNDYLLDAHARRRHTVLIIDEAQNLGSDVLEQLRLLTNLETSEKKLLQIILLGQPELRDILAQKELRQLAQRVTARYHLDSLSRAEVGAYVACRLAIAGRKQRLFSDRAIKTLYKLSGGVPRLINLLSDRALLGAYATNAELVDSTHIKHAYYEVKGESGSSWVKFIYQHGYRAIVVSLALLVFVGLGILVKPLLNSVGTVVAVDQESTSVVEGVSIPSTKMPELPRQQKNAQASRVGESLTMPLFAQDEQPAVSERKGDYIDEFATALSTSQDSLVAYVEAPSPDTKLFGQAAGRKQVFGAQQLNRPESKLGLRSHNTNDKFLAFQAVFQSWNLHYAEEPHWLACDFAELNGLACLHKQGNWRSLLRIDRPAVLTLFNDDGQKIHLALLKIVGETAKVSHAGEVFTTSLEEIDRFWLGEYSVVWKLPPYKSGIITPGQPLEGEWLESGLSQINPELKSLPLQQQVVEFQRTMGLVPDGIAGSLTLIQMNNLLEIATPKLLGNS